MTINFKRGITEKEKTRVVTALKAFVPTVQKLTVESVKTTGAHPIFVEELVDHLPGDVVLEGLSFEHVFITAASVCAPYGTDINRIKTLEYYGPVYSVHTNEQENADIYYRAPIGYVTIDLEDFAENGLVSGVRSKNGEIVCGPFDDGDATITSLKTALLNIVSDLGCAKLKRYSRHVARSVMTTFDKETPDDIYGKLLAIALDFVAFDIGIKHVRVDWSKLYHGNNLGLGINDLISRWKNPMPILHLTDNTGYDGSASLNRSCTINVAKAYAAPWALNINHHEDTVDTLSRIYGSKFSACLNIIFGRIFKYRMKLYESESDRDNDYEEE